MTMPEDFLSQLLDSKEKGLISLRQPFVVVQVPDTSYNKSSGLKKNYYILLSITSQIMSLLFLLILFRGFIKR